MNLQKLVISLLLLAFTSVISFSQPNFDENLVKFLTYLSFDKIHPGSELKIALETEVDSGWHINSNKPNEEFLIGTTVELTSENGLLVSQTIFPNHKDVNFSFSDKPVAVYEEHFFIGLLVNIPENLTPGDYKLKVTLNYQACNDASCMAPNSVDSTITISVVDKSTPVNFINAEKFSSINFVQAEPQEEVKSEESSLADTLEKSGLFISLLIVFLGGLALNLTPCVYPLIPITVGYFGGQSEGKTSRLFVLGLFYVLGMALTYSTVGVITALSGAVFGSLLQNPIVIIVVAAVIVALSLSMFGLYEFKLPDSLVAKAGGAKSGVFGAFIMGLTMGIVAAPCIGPFVLGLVTYVGAKADPVYGFFMFFFLALGLGLPYLILALFSGKIKNLPRSGMWMEAVKHIFGFLLLGMALYFLAPLFSKEVNFYLLPVFMIISGLYILIFEKTANDVKGFKIFKNILSLGVIVLAAWMLVPSEKNAPNWEKFSVEAYEQAINDKGMIFIDFYADWCIPCKELDMMTFSDERVISKLNDIKIFKVDMTVSLSEETEMIRQKFNIVGMPTLIFIGSDGKEFKRLTGFINADDFLKELSQLK